MSNKRNFANKRKLTSVELPAALEHIADSSDDDVFDSSDDVMMCYTHTHIHTHMYTPCLKATVHAGEEIVSESSIFYLLRPSSPHHHRI